MTINTGWRRYFAPLNLAAYVTWLAVVAESWLSGARSAPLGTLPGRSVALALLGLFIGGFLLATADAAPAPRGRAASGIALMLAAVAALLLLSPTTTTPVLLVILASVLTVRLGIRAAAAILLVANLFLLFVVLRSFPPNVALLLVGSYAGFQAFAVFATDAMRRADDAATQLRQVNAHLLATRSLLAESARDSERLRLSRELHDVSGHKLTALKLNLALLAREGGSAVTGLPTQPPALATARQLADELLNDLRGVVSQLRRFDGIDLRAALAHLAAPFPAPLIHVEVADDARIDAADQAEALTSVAQESLTNAVRHAAARHVWLRVRATAEALELTVEDDGRASKPLQEGNGIRGMRERIADLGGSFAATTTAGGGTRVVAILPRRNVP